MRRMRTAVLWLGTAATATALATAGPAYAGSPPSVEGQKYSDAQSKLSDAGYKPVVATTVGDQKAWPDCLVSNESAQTLAPPPNSSGSATNEVLVSLNCYSTNATATQAGYSAASPEGKQIAADKAKAAADAKAAAAKSGS
jgi:hypothetical protein